MNALRRRRARRARREAEVAVLGLALLVLAERAHAQGREVVTVNTVIDRWPRELYVDGERVLPAARGEQEDQIMPNHEIARISVPTDVERLSKFLELCDPGDMVRHYDGQLRVERPEASLPMAPFSDGAEGHGEHAGLQG